jgi:sortase B
MLFIKKPVLPTAGLPRKKRRLLSLVYIFGFTLIFIAVIGLFSTWVGYASARSEYAALREAYFSRSINAAELESNGKRPGNAVPDLAHIIHSGYVMPDEANAKVPGPGDINPDYAGWISIDGTPVNYPVVRGADNDSYLNKTFSGGKNAAGSIFFDYRCSGGFDDPVSVIYGHSMKDGSMFAGIKRYLDPDYMDKHPVIDITGPGGDKLTYRVFSAQVLHLTELMDFTDDYAADYLASQAPFENLNRFLILSTCVGSPYTNSRVLIFAALVK